MNPYQYSNKTDSQAVAADLALLSPKQMYMADNAAIASGISSKYLMYKAASFVAQTIISNWSKTNCLVLCGTGNNGGDGFIVACLLRQAGWPVRLALYGNRNNLKGDAAWAASLWPGAILNAVDLKLQNTGVIVDAIFGAGLNKPLAAHLQTLIQHINNSAIKVCAVDIPSGIDGANGKLMGAAIKADISCTFFRPKPGHYLLPGRAYCGDLYCGDIGINGSVINTIKPTIFHNQPRLWLDKINWPQITDHKYKRGHALLIGGSKMLGASRLASMAAARIGAGLVTLAVPSAVWSIQVAQLTSIMVEPIDLADISASLSDTRRNAILIGPGLGLAHKHKQAVLAVLATKRPCVLDADALSIFADEPAVLFSALHKNCILTPHAGEFARLFDLDTDKLTAVKAAVAATGALIVLKGADTIIAAADGRLAINSNAPAYLATAGSGDVLAGCIVGLLATGMPVFEAVCAAVWLHGNAAASLGYGLLAEDLPRQLPLSLLQLKN